MHSSTPDTPPDNLRNLPDSMPDTSPDTTPDSSKIEENFSKFAIGDLQKKYSIGRDPLYARMNYLQMTTWKIDGKAYLDADQTAHMDRLHEHIRQTGKMKGYPIPSPSGPVELEPEETTAIVEAAPQQISTQQGFVPTGERSHSSEMEPMNQLVKNAQNKATGVLIAENMLAAEYIKNPDKLPEELREKIKQSSVPPAVDPFAYASALMNFAGLAA
ncbi:hypothetical protein IQ272_25740 [Chroococcidiopsidales cyanobacterium LEGE 13417]|nr:hypothetical protein [Chroococcidiopsidales cyanobacterium LEGE 13417]